MKIKKGFTLVELSIVLVIIGLLIGGILVAQSMIDTARINAQIQQIGQFDAAVNNFITKYNSIPGDSTAMGCTGGTCGNGTIEDAASPNIGYVSHFSGEVANFWVQLGQSGFTQNGATFTATIPANGFDITSNNKNAPQSTIDPKSGVIAGTTKANQINGVPSWWNYFADMYEIANFSALTATNSIAIVGTPGLTAEQAYAIDVKMDDGLPNNGIVETSGISTTIACGTTGFGCDVGTTVATDTFCASGLAAGNSTAGAYILSNPGKVCSIMIQMSFQKNGVK